jgi:queuine tRNA-ribosyltransferase
MSLRFTVLQRSGLCNARTGQVTTPHGMFETPAFMPVGTRASVKGVLPAMLASTGAQICLANTYHLLLRPGPDIIERAGGLHRFMGWHAPILTDSGGYQAFSMADLNRVDDEGVLFRSVVDGSWVHLSPERAIRVQNQLGADIIMAFDDCPAAEPADTLATPTHRPDPQGSDPRPLRALRRDRIDGRAAHAQRLRQANERTVRWLERCKAAHARASDQALFGIIQGGTDLEQRTWSAQRVCAIELPGYAIGGVAVGEPSDQIARVVAHTAPLMPEDRPRYLMGVGYERDLLAAVRAGVDMFDCVLPTRNGRNANAFTPTGQIRLRNAVYADDRRPIESGCDCAACAGTGASHGPGAGGFSRDYLRHLFLAGEMLGPILVTLHNLRYFQRFMARIRRAVADDDWAGLEREYPVVARSGPTNPG